MQAVICSTETKISLFLDGHVRKMHKSVTEVLSLPYVRGSSHLLWTVLELSYLSVMSNELQYAASGEKWQKESAW